MSKDFVYFLWIAYKKLSPHFFPCIAGTPPGVLAVAVQWRPQAKGVGPIPARDTAGIQGCWNPHPIFRPLSSNPHPIFDHYPHIPHLYSVMREGAGAFYVERIAWRGRYLGGQTKKRVLDKKYKLEILQIYRAAVATFREGGGCGWFLCRKCETLTRKLTNISSPSFSSPTLARQTYGFEQIETLRNLQQTGLLSLKTDKFRFDIARKQLRLVKDDVDEVCERLLARWFFFSCYYWLGGLFLMPLLVRWFISHTAIS